MTPMIASPTTLRQQTTDDWCRRSHSIDRTCLDLKSKQLLDDLLTCAFEDEDMFENSFSSSQDDSTDCESSSFCGDDAPFLALTKASMDQMSTDDACTNSIPDTTLSSISQLETNNNNSIKLRNRSNDTPMELLSQLAAATASNMATSINMQQHEKQSRSSSSSKLFASNLAALQEFAAKQRVHQATMDVAAAATKVRPRAKKFPAKLMQALQKNAETCQQAFEWLPEGKSFIVLNPALFCNQVLKREFPKDCKYASFVRKLHRWGFVKVASGVAKDCFHHPLFQRDQHDLADKIVCLPRQPSTASRSSSTATASSSSGRTTPELQLDFELF